MRAWFLSDLHLTDINERSSQTLLRFLHSLATEEASGTHLFLLGDIFDVWVGNHLVFIEKWEPILTALKTLSLRGTKIYYCEGNHDMHLGAYWKKTIGAHVFAEPKIFKLGSWLVRVEHGDYINPNDKSYLRLRALLRSFPVKLLVWILPGSAWEKFGVWWSQKSRRKSRVIKQEVLDLIRTRIHSYAKNCREQFRFDYIITGHVHLRDRFEFKVEGQPVVSINLGSWYDKATVLQLTEHGETVVSLS